MSKTASTLLIAFCTSLVGGAGCSDDSQKTEPVTDGGLLTVTAETPTVDASIESAASSSSPAASITSNPNSETRSTSPDTVVSHASSEQSDASTTVTSSAPPLDAGADAGLDASIPLTDGGQDTTGVGSTETSDTWVAPDVEFTAPRGPCDVADRIGRFTVEAQKKFGVVQGSVSDAVQPTTIPSVIAESGDCRLDKRRTLTCLPACVAGETCGEGGQCIPFPAPISVGEIAVKGLTKPTSMFSQAPSYLYFAPGADNPPYAPLSEITMSTSGGTLSQFHLFGIGSEPLTDEPTWLLEEDKDFELTWPTTDANAGTSVLIEVTVDQHGVSPLSLSCEFPDIGSATVPASIINQLLQAGITGFPNGRITRRTVDHVDTDLGCIELAVGSPRGADIAVPGYTPCHGSEDCPEEQHCNIPLEKCEDD